MQHIFSILPIAGFFLAYKFGNKIIPQYEPIIIATGTIMACVILLWIYAIISKTKQDKMTIYSNIFIIIFGMMTIFFKDPVFIKLKITIINVLFGSFMVYNVYAKNPSIGKLFAGKIIMLDENWRKFALRLAILFFMIAIGNEIVWRNFSEEFWVSYKVFYVPIFSVIYFAFQVHFIMKYNISNKK